MSIAIKYSALGFLAFGAVLLVRALAVIFVPTTTPTPSDTTIQELLLQRLLAAGVVLAIGVAGYLLGRSRKAAA